jgi:hypothetical protein
MARREKKPRLRITQPRVILPAAASLVERGRGTFAKIESYQHLGSSSCRTTTLSRV